MNIRKLTLSEWFVQYQLKFAFFKFCHNFYTLDLDITHLVEAAEKQGRRFSPTATTVKAIGLLFVKQPRLNRMMFYTPFGERILDASEVRVNIPVIIHNQGDPVLSATVIKTPEEKSISEIQKEIRDFAQSDLNNKPLGRFAHQKKNTWYHRLFLKTIFNLVYRCPSFYFRKGGGTVSVTSIIKGDTPKMWLRGSAVGFTILTFVINGLKKINGRYYLLLGVDLNHSLLSGDEFVKACACLTDIFTSKDLL